MVLAPVDVGGKRSEAELFAAARRQVRLETRQRYERRAALAQAAAAHGIDAPAVLAEMLVPNIRPVVIQRSDCGPWNEVDAAAGEASYDEWLAGTPYAGAASNFWDILEPHEAEMIGPACNAEFRRRFADYLRRRLSAGVLRDAYLVLAPYWVGTDGPDATRGRLTAFAGDTRRAPVRWTIGGDEEARVARWLKRDPSGRLLQETLRDFWRESEPLLASEALACPSAAARWPVARAEILRQIDARMEPSGKRMPTPSSR